MEHYVRTGAAALAAMVLALVVGVTWAGAAGTAAEVKVVKFTARYAGLATVQVTDDVANIAANGAGKGTLLGRSKVTGRGLGDASARPCVPFSGRGSMFNAKKTKLNFQMLTGSQGCGDEEGNVFSVVGRAKVLGGTKAYKKAKGTLKLTGVYDRGQGTFSVKFSGKLRIP